MTPEQQLYFDGLLRDNHFNQFLAEGQAYGREDSLNFRSEAYEALGYHLSDKDWEVVFEHLCKA